MGLSHEQGGAAPDAAAGGEADAERALIARLLGGDEQAFVGLVRAHHGTLVRLAQLFVSSRASAEEVVQETWEAVLAGLHRFQGRSSLKTWIFRILTNRAKTRGVREGRVIPLSSLQEGSDEDEPLLDPARFRFWGGWAAPPQRWEERTPEKLLLLGEVRREIDAAIAALPPAQGAVITMRDVEGLGAREVCNVLEISETNQRVLLHRARSRVRAHLERYLAGES